MTPAYPNTPQLIAEVHQALWPEVVELHSQWTAYQQLFLAGDEVLNLLSWGADGFFAGLRDWMSDGVALGLGRLLDPAATGKKENLVIERLAEVCEQAGSAELGAEVHRHLDSARHYAIAARMHRNRRIAHADLATRLRIPSSALPAVAVSDITAALDAIGASMNAVERVYEGSTTAYGPVPQLGDAKVLLARLQAARDAVNRQRAEYRIPPE